MTLEQFALVAISVCVVALLVAALARRSRWPYAIAGPFAACYGWIGLIQLNWYFVIFGALTLLVSSISFIERGSD